MEHLQSADWSTIDRMNIVIFFFPKNTIQSEHTDHKKCWTCTQLSDLPISEGAISTNTLTNQLNTYNKMQIHMRWQFGIDS